MVAEIIQTTLERLRAGRAFTYQNLHVFPLYDNVACEPDYLTLDEALAQGSVHITELSVDGSVPELQLINEGGKAY